MLFPSLYEGFGLRVLEAMSLGTGVMTSNTAALNEVAGDAALLVDPLDIRAMTKATQKIDADGDLRADLGQRGSNVPGYFRRKPTVNASAVFMVCYLRARANHEADGTSRMRATVACSTRARL